MGKTHAVQSDSASALPGGSWKTTFRRKLREWYRRNLRQLPWRDTQDPYAIWVSEIMLQQTQVATVIPYYRRFLDRYPDVAALAAAPEAEVLRQWEGLGYYRRARQLHRAAQVICEQHGANFPINFDDVLALPGIGRYTAGAVTSFAFDDRRPALEANTIRLFTRLLAYKGDPRSAAGQSLLWDAAEDVLPRNGSGLINQALMELGSQVCKPRNPNCEACPAVSLCGAYEQDLVETLPRFANKMRYEKRKEAAVVIRDRGRVLLRECQPDERWAGLWDFPRFHLKSRAAGGAQRRELQRHLDALTGNEVTVGDKLLTIRHGVTRYRIELDCYAASFDERPKRLQAPLKWTRLSDLESYPLSVTGRKIARLL